MKKVRLGIIGCSSRIKALLNLNENFLNRIEISALLDPDPQRIADFRASFNRDACEYSDNVTIVNDPDLDWIAVAGWNSVHAEAAIAALKAGKNLFIEKPVATNFSDCIRLAEAAAHSPSVIMVGFSLRYAQLYNKIHDLIESGMLGRIISMEFNENLNFNHGGHIMSCWRRKREFTGCHLLEKCCHDIDLVNWMVNDRVERIASFGGLNFFTPENAYHIERLKRSSEGYRPYCAWPTARNSNPFLTDKDIIDNQVVIIEYRNGVRATFHTNLNAGIPERRMYILGSEGGLRADLVSGKLEYQRVGFDEKLQTVNVDCADGHGGGDTHLVDYWSQMMFEHMPSKTDLNTGIEATTVCLAADDAMRTGQIVNLCSNWEMLNNISRPTINN